MTETPFRERAGQYASYIGTAGLLMGILGWVWQGYITLIIQILLVIGVVGIAAWFALTPDDAIGLVTGRQARHGTVSVLLTLVLITLVVLVYIMLQRATITLDMTERTDFTLDDATMRVLDRLINNPTIANIQITGFYSPQSLPLREIDDQIFRLYETYTDGRVRRVYYDPGEEPALAQSFGMQFEGDVFVSYVSESGEVNFDSVAPIYRATNTERDTTEALNRLLARGSFKIYFEYDYTGVNLLDTGQQGMTNVLEGMRSNGIQVAPLYLYELEQSGGLIPADASAVVLTRGELDLSQAAINILDQYLKRGGALMILADAMFTQNPPFLAEDGLFNQYLWNNYGIRALDAVVVDRIASGATQIDVSSFVTYPDNNIAARLNQENDQSTAPVFRITRALELSPTAPVTNGQVIASSPESYGETDWTTLSTTGNFFYDAASDINGPFTLVAWAHDQNTNAKIVLIGDNDFVLNGQVLAPFGNSILFTDAIGWLSGYSSEVSIGAQAFSTGLVVLFISPSQLDQIALFTVVLMPGVVLLIGLVVWVRRNRR